MPTVIIPPTDVSPYTGTGSQVLATNPVFPGNITVSGTGVSTFGTTGKTAIQQFAGSGALVAGGWLYGVDEGLNFAPNGAGLNKKLVMAHWDGSAYRSVLEYSNVSSGTATLKLSDYGGLTTVGGNLTVNGTGTSTLSGDLEVKKSLFIFGGNASSSGQITANSAAGGLYFLNQGTSTGMRFYVTDGSANPVLAQTFDANTGNATLGGNLTINTSGNSFVELLTSGVQKCNWQLSGNNVFLDCISGSLNFRTLSASVITLRTNSTTALTLDSSQNAEFNGYLTYNNAGADTKAIFNRTGGNTFSFEHETARFTLYNRGTSGYAWLATNAGSFVVGNTADLATTATDGFLYVPQCAGTPTGTPTAISGKVPIVVDYTNHKLYFYSGGAWRDAGP